MNRTRLSDSELAALAARIQRDYDYDDHSGKLVNKRTGKVVRGTFRNASKKKYRSFDFRFGGEVKHLNYHWAVWAWHNGCFPTMQIDHINGNGFDNRIGNLREVTQSENMRNQYRPWKPNAKSGLPGVYKNGSGYRIKIAQYHYHFRDRFEAFYHLTLLGRRFK